MGAILGKAAFAAAAQARNSALATRRDGWFRRQSFGQSVMASPPTVTVGTSTSMTAGYFNYPGNGNAFFNAATMVSNRFAFARGAFDPALVGNSVAVFANITVNNTPAYGGGGGAMQVSFIVDDSDFELVLSANSTYFLVKIDDQYVSLTPTSTGSSGTCFAKFSFGSRQRHRVDLIGWNTAFAGVNLNPTGSIDPAPIRGPRAIAIGDSFTAGVGASGLTANNWVAVLADQMGWDDLWASGLGGTGLLATNGGTGPTFRGRLQHDVIQYNPDIVISVVPSVNDWGSTPSAIGSEANLYFAQLRAGLPNALLFAGPNANGGVNRTSANALAVIDATKAAALANGVIWINPQELPIRFVSGTAISGTTYGATSAGLAGGTGIYLYNVPRFGSTIEIGTGATRERVQLKTFSQGGTNLYLALFDGTMQYAHAAGETWTEVGGSYLTGTGRAGATSGFGNSDVNVSSDGTHPTTAGHAAMGRTWATLLKGAALV